MTTSAYTTRELSQETWPDFESFFSRGNGWDYCWCTAFQSAHAASTDKLRTRPQMSGPNHEEKRDLVGQDEAHGVLVYADGEAIGWCQFGSAYELTAWGGRRSAGLDEGEGPTWRITCFVTDKRYRRKGVAYLALEAALSAIQDRGGGLVEAYPVAHWRVDHELQRLIRLHGLESDEVRLHSERRSQPASVFIQGVGPLIPAHGTFGNTSTSGTASMFERAGFTAVRVLGGTHVVMQKWVE